MPLGRPSLARTIRFPKFPVIKRSGHSISTEHSGGEILDDLEHHHQKRSSIRGVRQPDEFSNSQRNDCGKAHHEPIVENEIENKRSVIKGFQRTVTVTQSGPGTQPLEAS
jgi:hypothetical protein